MKKQRAFFCGKTKKILTIGRYILGVSVIGLVSCEEDDLPPPNSTFSTAQIWHENFGFYDRAPLVGDFNGDGRDDAVILHLGNSGDVYVALSEGEKFQDEPTKWHDALGFHNRVPLVGDFNNDGLDDIAICHLGNSGDVYVALSEGDKFQDEPTKWHDALGFHNRVPLVGDFNNDGLDDIAICHLGNSGDVYVAFSEGDKFQDEPTKWHDALGFYDRVPLVGDFNPDCKLPLFSNGSN